MTAGGTAPRDFQVWNSSTLNIDAGGEEDFWITWHDDNSGNNKTMSVTYTYTVVNPIGETQVFGPYTIPVAKVFNTTCTGNPTPTIPTGPARTDGSPYSHCPEPGSGERVVEQEPVVEEKPVVEQEPVIEEPKEEIQPVIEAEVTEGAPAAAKTAPADAEADA